MGVRFPPNADARPHYALRTVVSCDVARADLPFLHMMRSLIVPTLGRQSPAISMVGYHK